MMVIEMDNVSCDSAFLHLDMSDSQARERHTQLPYISLAMGVAFVGMVANLHVMIILWRYFKHETFIIYLKVLSICDFTSCLGMFIKNFSEYLVCPLVYYSVGTACRISNFALFTMTEWSMWLILAISYDRYVHICKPLQPSITQKRAWVTCALGCVFALLGCFPLLFVYGNRSIRVQDGQEVIYMVECGISDDVQGTVLPEVYFAIVDGLGLILPIAVSIMYIKMWKATSLGIKSRKQLIFTERRLQASNGSPSTIANSPGDGSSMLSLNSKSPVPKREVAIESTRKLVAIAIIISLLFFISNTIGLVIETSKAFEQGTAVIERYKFMFYRFGFNAVFFNNIFNPFVYFFNHSRLRKGLIKMYSCGKGQASSPVC